ncbi:MAG: molecular chaperone DnaK [Desulfuromonas sp.]|nr:MAG: molecular chaperone DnaK [Desulfuromonas sp.]
MKKKDVEKAKKMLLQMRREVTSEVQENYAASREIGQSNLPDLADVSSNAYSREMLLNLTDAQHRKLKDIDAALERLENDEYGICASCGDDIAPRRMEVRPFSRYCIECKTDIEKFGE